MFIENQLLIYFYNFSFRTMSSKRKSPPTKLDGGVASGPIGASHDSLPCSNSPSINSENCGSEPDLDSYRSSSPASDSEMRAQTATPSDSGGGGCGDNKRHKNREQRRSGDLSGSDHGNNSDNEAPMKKQKIEPEMLPYNVRN